MKKKHKKMTYETPLHIACKKGYVKLVKFLLNTKGIDVNSLSYTRENFHFTPLHFAVLSNQLEIVKLLLSSDLIKVNEKGVQINYEFRKYSVLKLNFFFYSSNFFLIFNRVANLTPLHLACDKSFTEIVAALLTNNDIDVNCQTKFEIFE